MMRVLFFAPIPISGASCRYRIQQYLPYLRDNGIEGRIVPFCSPSFYEILYQPRRYWQKMRFFIQSTVQRVRDVIESRSVGGVVVHREAFPIGPPLLEWILARRFKKSLVFDFDDALYLGDISEANRSWGFLKYPQKIPQVISMSTSVIAGNAFLAAYASKFNHKVSIIPTPIDTDVYVPHETALKREPDGRPVQIGWIGSPTTAKYLLELGPTLSTLSRAGAPLVLKVVGAGWPVAFPGVSVINRAWSLDRELEEFQSCDIGIYPLTNDEWGRGKCGFKAIQFMAVGVPVVASAVGVNKEIIKDGINGFLASSPEEWCDKLQRLIKDPDLRHDLGLAGRETVRREYSLKENAPRFYKVLTDTFSGRSRLPE